MFWIALAAQLSAPIPKEVWFKNSDTPLAELSKMGAARVLIRITVDPSGALLSCDVEESSGNNPVDERACKVTRQRARFSPARSAEGTATYGVLRLPVLWLMSPMEVPPRGDMTVFVDRLPRGLKSPETVLLTFAADAKGHISACAADRRNRVPALVPLACDQLRKQYTAIPAKTADGSAIPSVQNGVVVFEIARKKR